MNKQKFKYRSKDGWVNVNTLSPSGRWYYQIKMPVSLNPAAFGCRIAFFSIDGKLFYNRNKHYAHELHSEKEIQESLTALQNGLIRTPQAETEPLAFVKWSEEGNMAFFREYSLEGDFSFYEDVFINFSERYCIRLDTIKDILIINEINPIEFCFNENETTRLLDKYSAKKYPLIIDVRINQWLNKFLFRRWHPIL